MCENGLQASQGSGEEKKLNCFKKRIDDKNLKIRVNIQTPKSARTSKHCAKMDSRPPREEKKVNCFKKRIDEKHLKIRVNIHIQTPKSARTSKHCAKMDSRPPRELVKKKRCTALKKGLMKKT